MFDDMCFEEKCQSGNARCSEMAKEKESIVSKQAIAVNGMRGEYDL
jgi:hypothetical protein